MNKKKNAKNMIEVGTQTEEMELEESPLSLENTDTNEENKEKEKESVKEEITAKRSEFDWGPLPNLVFSFRKNLKSWGCFILAIFLISKNTSFSRGLATLVVMLFLVYWIHWESHVERNWFTISHHYHHEENNWFSHGIQILLEFQFGLALPVLNEFLFDNILDKWVIIFLYIFYSSVHNINYSMFHINKTHELHHENIFTNIGPDVCDILFETKNDSIINEDGYIEDTSHYIPNIMIGMFVVLILRNLYKDPGIKIVMDVWSYICLAIVSLIIIISNTYLINFYEKKVHCLAT